jgi:hypothetical protein
LKALCEIKHNVLKGTVVLSPSEKNIEEIQENINPFGEKEIYETRETKSNTKRVNGRCSFIEYCWSFIMDKMILISYEKYRNLTSRQTSKELKGTGYQMTKKRKL